MQGCYQREGADLVRSIAVLEGNEVLAGINGGQKVLHTSHDELGRFTAAARRQHGEGSHASLGLGVVDVFLAGIGEHLHGITAGIEHTGGLALDGVGQSVSGVGLAAEHDGVTASVLNGFPADSHVGGFTGGEGSGSSLGSRGRKGRVHRGHILAPGQLGQGHRAGRINVYPALGGDVADEDLLGGRGIGHGRDTTLDDEVSALHGLHGHNDVGGSFAGGAGHHGTGLRYLEGHITGGGNTLTVGDGGAIKAEDTVGRHDGSLLGAGEKDTVTHHFFLDGAGEVLGVGKVPGVGTVQCRLGKVFGFLHIRSPPLGSAHLLVGDDGVGIQVEEACGSIVAGILFQRAETGGSSGPGIGEVGCHHVKVPVVGSGQGNVGGRLVLGVGRSQGSLFHHVEDEVVLERGSSGDNLQAEDTGVVGVVHEVQVHDGIVLHHQVVNGTGIDTDEGTHALEDGVVDKGELGHAGSAADVEDIAATGTIGVDIGDFAAVVHHVTQHHGLAPLIHETLAVAGDDAVLVGDVANGLAVYGAAILVLDGKAEAGRTGSGRAAVELDTLEIDIGAGPGIGELEFALQDGLGTIGGFLTHQGEAGPDFHGLDIVRGTFHLQEDLGALRLHGVLEGVHGGNLGEAFGGRSGPGIHLAAAGAEEVEGEHILLAGFQTVDGSCSGHNLVGGEGVGCHYLVGAGEGDLDAVYFLEIGHVLAPGEAYAGSLTVGHLHIKVILDGEGLEGLAVFGHLGGLLAFGSSLHGESVGFVGVQFLLVRDGRGGHRFRQIDITV